MTILTPERLSDFIPAAQIEELLRRRRPADAAEVRDVLAISAAKQRLSLEQMATLLSVTDADLQEGSSTPPARSSAPSTATASSCSRRCTSATTASTTASTAGSALETGGSPSHPERG